MSSNGEFPLIIIGGGGHASCLAEILLLQKRKIVAVVSPDAIDDRQVFDGLTHLQDDTAITEYAPDEVRLVNGIGMLPGATLREDISERFVRLGYTFASVISAQAWVSPYASIDHGVQIFPGAIVQTGACIGAHTIVNTGALVEHDCKIGNYNHIAPRAALCGQVTTGARVFIGAGATVIQNVAIGANVIVGAATCVTKSQKRGVIVRQEEGGVQHVAEKRGTKR